MYPIASHELTRATIENRIREADQQRLAREVQRQEQPSTARPTPAHAVREPRSHSRLWSLIHLPQATS